jgi:molecular chaperone DnaK (HSP70)
VSHVVDELGAAAIDFAALHLPASGPHSELVAIYGAGVGGCAAALARVAVDARGHLTVHVLADEASDAVGGADLDELVLALARAQFDGDLEAVFGAARVRTELRRIKEVCLTQEACRWLMVNDDGVKFDATLLKPDVTE